VPRISNAGFSPAPPRALCVALGLAVALVAASAPIAMAQEAPDRLTIVHAGTLLAVPGEAPRVRQSLVVRNGRVERVEDGFLTASDLGTQGPVGIVNLSSSFVLPGLIDLHTHITGELGPDSKIRAVTLTPVDHALNGVVFLRRTLEAGFTTIRNTGGDPEVMFSLRRGVEEGKVAGPTVFAAGAGISGTGGHADNHGFLEEILDLYQSSGICDGANDCRRAVRTQVKRGSDWIKITATGGVLSETAAGVGQQLFADELGAIVETAGMMGRKVAAHAHGTDGINAALRAGVATIEHGTYGDDSSFALFKETGAYLVPTILAGVTVAKMASESDFMPAPIKAKALEVGPQMIEMVRQAHAAGVKIAFGTDSGVSRHGDNAREFGLMVEAGMTEMEAIVAATVTAAEVLGIAGEVGTLEPGRRADLIATSKSPLENVGELMDIRLVMKGGEVYSDRDGAVVPSVSTDAGSGDEPVGAAR
jgi:imidazolonepropionase-like amidohydrolase